jgi:hypothetical protein
MKIELKNVKFSEHLSEETNAFTADIYVNGKKVAYAKNDGQGGCTFYHCYEGNREIVAEVEAYCENLPPIQYEFGDYKGEMKSNLENVIDQLFEGWLKNKDKERLDKKLKKDIEKGICFKTDNGYSIVSWKGFDIPKLLSHPHGKISLQKEIKKLQEEGKEILNTNIPAEFFS